MNRNDISWWAVSEKDFNALPMIIEGISERAQSKWEYIYDLLAEEALLMTEESGFWAIRDLLAKGLFEFFPELEAKMKPLMEKPSVDEGI